MSRDLVNSTQPVYLVVLHGSFVDTKSYAPLAAADPRGTQMYFQMDVMTHSVLDFGITSSSPKANSLGEVHAFSP